MALNGPRLAFDNPVDAKNLPKSPLQVQWPVREDRATERAFIFKTFLGLIGVSAASMVFRAMVSQDDTYDGSFFFVLVAMYFCICIGKTLNCEAGVCIPLFIVSLALLFSLLPTLFCVLGAAILLPIAALLFRQHYVEFCSTSPLDRTTAERFRKQGLIPATVTPMPMAHAFWDAVNTWFIYNRRRCSLPGLWQSPAGSQIRRFGVSAALIAMLANVVPDLIMSQRPELFPDEPSSPLIALSVAFCLPVPVFLFACFLASYSILPKAAGLRAYATLANQWPAFLNDLASAPNQQERDSIYMGNVASDSSPVHNPVRSFSQHLWIVGATGSRKTTYLMFLVEQLIQRNVSVLVLDLKADSFELLHTLNAAAKHNVNTWHFTDRHGWATQFCSPFSQAYWKHISPSQRTDIHLSSMGMGTSRDYGVSWYDDACYHLLDFVNHKYPNINSYQELCERLAYEIAHAGTHELSAAVKRDGEHIRIIIQRLAKVEMLNPMPHHPQSARDAALDLSMLFETQGVAYCGLNSLVAPIVSGEISRIMLESLLATATNTRNKKHEVVLIVDEFQQMVAPGALQLALRQARSLGISIILSNQTVSDLRTAKNDFASTVEGNTSTQMWMKGCGTDAVDQIQRLGGKAIDVLYSTSSLPDGGTTVTSHEILVDRFDATTIGKVSSDAGSFLMRITNNDAYAQYNGIPFIARCDYHLRESEYIRRTRAPWPSQTSKSVIVGGSNSPPSPPAIAVPLPIPPAPVPTAAAASTLNTPPPSPRPKQRNIIGSGTLGRRP